VFILNIVPDMELHFQKGMYFYIFIFIFIFTF